MGPLRATSPPTPKGPTAEREPQQPWPPEWAPRPGKPVPAPPPPPTTPTHPPTLPMIVTPVEEHRHDPVAEQLLERRIVMLTGRLDDEAAEDTAARLLLLDERAHEPITLHISCPEAEVDAALTLVTTIDLIRSKVRAIAAGTVAGPAVAVYAAAADRKAHPHASFVLTEPSGQLRGDAEQIGIAAEQHRRQLDTLRERVATTTGQPKDTVETDMRDGRLLTAPEAVDYGLVQALTTHE